MAVPILILYKNDGSGNYITSNATTYPVFPSAEELSWSVSGSHLDNWNSSDDGTGSSYAIGDLVPEEGGRFYAIWVENVHEVAISYKDNVIATMDTSGTTTLNTAGTYCEDDIEVVYTKPGGSINLQSKSATPTESAQTITPDSGYDGLSQVSVGAISSFYVGSNVPRQAAQTITPTTTDQTIASGKYLTGTQTIKGDANLLAENIKKDVVLFGITGTLESGGGGGLVYEEGTYEPTADTMYWSGIRFSNVHSDSPFFFLICDVTGTTPAAKSILSAAIISQYYLSGDIIISNTNSPIYGTINYLSQYNSSSTGNTNSSISTLANLAEVLSSSGVNPGGNTSRYFRANRTYKWIAVWKPTT